MPGKDNHASALGARPAAGGGQSRAGSAKDLSRGKDVGGGAGRPLSGSGRGGERGGAATHSEDRGGRTALGTQTIGGAVDQHDTYTRGRLFQPPAILRAPSSLLSHPLFLHPVQQLGAPFRALSAPLHLPAPILFPPLVGASRPSAPANSTAAQTQTPDVPQPPAEVPSPKVELSVTSSNTAPTSDAQESPSNAVTFPAAASPSPSPENAFASTPTSDSPPDISPIAFATGEPVSASLVDTSCTNTSPDIPPATNTGGKVAAACVIGAVFLLLLNWAFWLVNVIRRRRRARRLLPAHWDFASPVRAKGDAGRESEDAFAHSDDEREVAKGGMVTVPV